MTTSSTLTGSTSAGSTSTGSTTTAGTGRPTVILARYGLPQPEVEDARAALERLLPAGADEVWADLLAHAHALAPGMPTLRDVLDAMRLHPHPLVVLAATSLEVRLRTFETLAGQGHVLHH